MSNNEIVALRVANESFLVNSTIERCPKTMMLRELVMNALEAATVGEDGAGVVRISACTIDGVRKLRIWNTGRGMTGAELHSVCDLSSSLYKTMGLDANFGMGAKVASLASNKLGMRFRSCRAGVVSQVLLGQRGGVFGRVLQPVVGGAPAEVLDVTTACAADGDYSLEHDWTEVVLMGNRAEQDTVLSPFDENPPMGSDWLMVSLGRRFYGLPDNVSITVDGSAQPDGVTRHFSSCFADNCFDRVERVLTADGVAVRYGYRATDSQRPIGAFEAAGRGIIVSNDEIYAITEGRRWLLEAPSYGLTFAARNCTIVIELPPDYAARPEVYRQFLRFSEGDQRQILFSDFGELVRTHIPGWLRRIIAAQMPDDEDFLREIRGEAQALMQQLGVADQLSSQSAAAAANAAPPADQQKQATPASEKRPPGQPKPPAKPRLPNPPEIIKVENEDEIAERGLAGRAGRYYRTSRQLFVNIRYAAFTRLTAQLGAEFADAADETTIEQIATQVAEWTLIRRLLRSVIHSLSKERLGWNLDEVGAVQTPEALSLQIDDYELLLPQARQRMAAALGHELPEGGAGFGAGDDGSVRQAERLASELAMAHASLHRAKAANTTRLGPYYRRIATIETRRRNWTAAEAALEHAIALDPEDPGPYHDLAGLRLAQGNLPAAAEAAAAAHARAESTSLIYVRRRANIEMRRGNHAMAEMLLREAMASDPTDPGPHHDLASLRMTQGDLDGAATACREALARVEGPASVMYLRRMALVETRRGHFDAAQALLDMALELNPDDPGVYEELASLRVGRGDLAGAAEAAEAAQTRALTVAPSMLRRRATIEARRGNPLGAQHLLLQAIAIDPKDAASHHELAGLRMELGDLAGAAEAAEAAHANASGSPVSYLRRRAAIEVRRQNFTGAIPLLEEAAALAPDDALSLYDLAWARLGTGDADAAAETARRARDLAAGTALEARVLRRMATIELRRREFADAEVLMERAISLNPDDPMAYYELSGIYLASGDLGSARNAIEQAIERSPLPSAILFRRRSEVAVRQRDLPAARRWLDEAIAADPSAARNQLDLSNLLLLSGDLEGASRAADEALRLDGGTPAELQLQRVRQVSRDYTAVTAA